MNNLNIVSAYVGSDQVERLYLGSDIIWEMTQPTPPEPVYSAMPLTFEIISAGTINWQPSDSSAGTKSIQYKVNEGEWEWTQSADSATTTINVNAGDKVQIRGFDSGYTIVASGNHYWSFCGSTAVFEAYGNIMSLIFNDLTGTIMDSCALYRLFMGCTGLTSAENLILPATTLADYCYGGMFREDGNLTHAPELPATALAENCYYGMFSNCTSLTQAPELPATTLAPYCYDSMFFACTGLTAAPSILPATTLASNCYQYMFNGCTSLVTAPALPATTLANYCYRSMFYGCTSLTQAPELPATTLVNYCYYNMFYDCTSLNYVKCLATSRSSSNSTSNWLKNTSPTGTFVKHPNASFWATGYSGIPDGWTVQNAVI